jgi:hypothetical protein
MHLDLYQVAWKYNVPNHRRLVSIKSSSNCHIRSRFFGLDPRNAENNHANTKKRIFFRVLSYGCNNCVSWCEGMNPSTDIDFTQTAQAKSALAADSREPNLSQDSLSKNAQKKEIDPDLILRAPSKADRSEPVKILGLVMPEPVSNLLYDMGDLASRARFKTLSVLPGFIVNHSSNAIGMTQLVGEALYFKSSGVGKFVEEHQKGSWKVIFAPPYNVVKGVFKKSAFHIDYKQLFNPKYMGAEISRFFDRAKAAEVDLARDGKLSNRWSARSGFSGMTAMAIAAAFPDEKDDPAVTEKMAIMATDSPLRYVGHRVAKGLMFPLTASVGVIKKIFSPNEDFHIGDGKREFSGIGMTLTGLFSVLAGFRQPRSLGNAHRYDFNKWQSLGGMITTFAGAQLLLSLDNQQGWTNYGKTQFARLAVLPHSIKERFPNKDGWGDPNAQFYFAAQGVFQAKNVVASLIGGAQKLPDGTIIDQKKKRSEIKEKAHQFKKAHTSTQENLIPETKRNNDVPTSLVGSISNVERAMPERVAMVAESKEAATV